MKKQLLSVLFIFVICSASSQITNTSWRFYRPGNTGIQGDMATSLWIDSNGNPYIAANTGNWGEGGFAQFNTLQNKWINYSNVDLPILGGFDDGDIQILDIVSDASGTLWMAKMSGGLRFNPTIGASSISSFNNSNSQLTGPSYDVDVAPDGTVWFANQQLVRYNPSTQIWTTFGPANMRLSVQPKPNGSYLVWSADTYNGIVMRYDSTTNSVSSYTPTNAGEIAGLPGKDCLDASGNFWALRLSSNGAFETLEYQQPNGNWVHPTHPYGDEVSFYIDAFKAYGNGQAVLVTTTCEVWHFDGNSWHNYGNWRSGSNTTAVDIDANGNVWVCGLQGAAKRDAISGLWQRYRTTNTSQIDYFVEDLTQGENGTIWMTGNAGTGVGGIQKFDGSNWIGFNPYTYGLGYDFPFDADNTTAIAYRPSSNSIVFSPTSHGIHQWDGVSYSTLESEFYTSKGLVEDAVGKLWNLGEYYHYKLYNGTLNQWTTFPIVGWGSKITKDPNEADAVWVTTDYEIVRTNGTNTFTFNENAIPGSVAGVSGFAAEPNGVFWTAVLIPSLSSSSSIIRFNSNTGQYQSWSPGVNWPFPTENVRPLTVTPDGRVWMQYDDEYPSTVAGILAFDGTTVTDFPSSPGGVPNWNVLPNSTIKDVEVVPLIDGYELWMSCLGRGVAVLKVTTSTLSSDFHTSNTISSLGVFPNPASDTVSFVFPNQLSGQVTSTVFDVTGRLVAQFGCNIDANHSIQWDILGNDGVKLATGMYFVRVNTSLGELTTKFIVK